MTFEEAQALVSTLLLLPAMLALIVFALRGGSGESGEHWTPTRFPERDWWSEDDPR